MRLFICRAAQSRFVRLPLIPVMTRNQLLLLATVGVAFAPPVSARATAMQYGADTVDDSLRSADTAAVLQVAAQFGLGHPVRLESHFPYDIGCPVVRAVSPVTVYGDRHSWFELTVRRKGRDTGGHPCQLYETDGTKVRTSGRWIASPAELSEQVQWRMHDGDWYVDVALGTGVNYEDAKLIVHAVRQGTLVNRIPAALRRFYGDTLPVIKAGDIREISLSSDKAYTFEVSTGQMAGTVLYVSILGGQVLVQNIANSRS